MLGFSSVVSVISVIPVNISLPRIVLICKSSKALWRLMAVPLNSSFSVIYICGNGFSVVRFQSVSKMSNLLSRSSSFSLCSISIIMLRSVCESSSDSNSSSLDLQSLFEASVLPSVLSMVSGSRGFSFGVLHR